MTSLSKSAGMPPSNSQKRTKWGQVCLVSAVILNAAVLAINLHLTSLQGELQSKRYDEQYFIINEQSKSLEESKLLLLQGVADQLVLARRLADDRMTEDERMTFLSNVKELRYQVNVSKVRIVAIAYLQANDPPTGTDVFELFKNKSDSELADLQKNYEKSVGDYIISLKRQMVLLMDSISIWKSVHSFALILSTSMLIIGTIINFRSELVGRE